ncbi:MAG: ComF family protein [Bacteroidia bacterium]
MKLFSGILDLIYPVVCINCGNSLVTHETVLCVFCAVKLPVTNFHKDPVNDMTKALWGRVNIDFATAFLYFKKAGVTQKLLHLLKYRGRKDIGINLGQRFGNHLKENTFVSATDFLIPVPLHKNKLKARGFNQSQLICDGLSEALSIPVVANLSRIYSTDTQTHKRRFERWMNVSEKFVVSEPEKLEGKRVLLVDDVFTTGATIEACCQALMGIKDISIGVATLAVAVH